MKGAGRITGFTRFKAIESPLKGVSMTQFKLVYPDALLSGEFAGYAKYPETRIYIRRKDKIFRSKKPKSQRRERHRVEDLIEDFDDRLSMLDEASSRGGSASYVDMAGIAAQVNRNELQKGELVERWCFCVPYGPRHFGGYMSELFNDGLGDWVPENEYDLPPTNHVERCSWSELKTRIEELNHSLHADYLSDEDTDTPLMWAVPALWIDKERGLASCLKSTD